MLAGAALSVSACDPGGKRVAQFDVEVPPGDYQVHLTVDDRRGRRGLVRLESHVAPPSDQLTVSELVVLCGTTPGYAPGGPVRLEPDFDRRMGRAGTVSAYFEIDRLSLDTDGRGRFAYHYALRRTDGDAPPGRRPEPAYQASREEENVGARRRQFVSVPLPALEPGSYDLEIVVHDLRSNETATRSIRLRKT